MPSEPPFNPQTSFLGTGWSFPPEFDHASGTVLMTSDEADIEASLKILLGTSAGERFLKPEYGLDLHQLIFEPISTTVATLLKDSIKVKILIYEPRIDVLSLEIDMGGHKEDQMQGVARILLEYVVRATNSRYNLVYPFYIHDGSEVRPTRIVLPTM